VPHDHHFRTDEVEANLGRRSARGGRLAVAGQGGRLLVTVVLTAVLARLLTPADFGLVAMVTSITVLLVQIADLGLTASTVQRAEIDHAKISTLFWINLAFSGGLTLLVAASAPVIAWFFGEPRLVAITLAVAPIALITGAAVQHRALLMRQMRFGPLALLNVLVPTLALGGGVVAAMLGAGYWAQVLVVVVTPLLMSAGLWIACPWRPGGAVRGSGVRSMVAFGGNLTGVRSLGLLVRNVARILVGKLIGAEALGIYGKAFYLFHAPTQQLGQTLSGVAVATLSRLQDEPERYRRFHGRGVELLSAVAVPLAVFGYLVPDRVVLGVLGSQWDPAVPVFRALAPAVLMTSLLWAASWAYESLGHTARQLRWSIVETAITIAALAVGVFRGVVGVAIAYSSALVVLRPLALAYCYRGTPLRTRDLPGVLALPGTAAVVAGASVWLLERYVLRGWGGAAPSEAVMLGALAVDGVVFAAIYAGVWLGMPRGRRVLRETLELLRAPAPVASPASLEE
jgi:O-antigen/teichoic acid export membrane protein